jgi:hypothetical protein
MNRLLTGVICASVLQAQVRPQGPEFGFHGVRFVVKLLSPLSTRTAREGDTFTGSVETPSQYQGALVEGKITKLKKPRKGKGTGKPEIQFQFDTFTYNNRTGRIAANLVDVANSQGVRNVDEEGRVVGKTSNKKRVGAVAAGAAAGALIGVLTGGGAGAAVGAAAGAAAGLVIGVKMTTTGSDIEFRPGSRFTLTVSDATNKK